MNELPFIEMFSGIGGFRLGLEYSNWKCVWANDWDKWANKIYKKNFSDGELIEGNIRTIDASSIPNHTLLTAGFPCEAFSIAGKRKGFEDTRGTLFYDVARITKVKKPLLILLENVKGLLNHDKGRTFARILQTLDEMGYWIEWQVFNSKRFGVPQSRGRLFIVGHSRKKRTKPIFPVTQNDGRMEKSIKKVWDGRYKLKKDYSYSNRLYSIHGISPTIVKAGGGRHIPQFFEIKRRLTPTECERLQGFPDGWTEGLSDTQRYNVLGNAVTVNVIKILGSKLRKCI